jgi:ankyrin repeat protein
MHKNKKYLIVFSFLSIFSTSAFSAYNDMHKAVEDNDVSKVENLLNTKTTLLQEFDDNGNTPLHKAILENKNASLQAFMKFKRYINTQIINQSGETPLVYAIKNKKYNSVIFMLDNGVNPFYKDSKQKNSLDYVKEFGDDTTKQIYNEYYSRNRDKIIRLQESFKDPIDLGVFKDEKSQVAGNSTQSDEIKYKKPKISTVQDLLIGNSKSRNLTPVPAENKKTVSTVVVSTVNDGKPITPLVMNDAAKPVSVSKENIQDIKDKIEQSNVDNKLIEDMKTRMALLEKENSYLKNKIDLKAATGKEELNSAEENVARSQYAGIYEQQLVYGDVTTNEAGIPIFDESNIIVPEENMPVVGDVIDYKSATMKTLNNIEQEFPAISSNIENAIKTEVNSDKVVLPVDILPDNKAIVSPSLDNKKDIVVTPIVKESDKNVDLIDNKKQEPVKTDIVKEDSNSVKVNTVNDLGKIEVKDIKPTLKIEESKATFKSEFSKKMSSDFSVALILSTIVLGLISISVFCVSSIRDFKRKKNKTEVKEVAKKEQKNISIEVSKKDKI